MEWEWDDKGMKEKTGKQEYKLHFHDFLQANWIPYHMKSSKETDVCQINIGGDIKLPF